MSLIALANCAQTSAVSDGTTIPSETLAPLASWVGQATKVPMVSLPITVASNTRLKSAMGLEGVQQARAMAAYLPGQIVINNLAWDPESLRSQSYLVHELVHHAQLLSGRKYACHAAKESEAYRLQNQWLVEHGLSAITSDQWIAEIASCKGDADDHGSL
ncbi:MAG: DUF6647 family protein [Alphaproteobacteria bacterium]|nr:DUF6647 family protein [Alphaproteobacteria bacterium]